jgi:hypothetical protein
MRNKRSVLDNIYQPKTKGYFIYDYGDGRYQASRMIGAGNSKTRTFFTLEDCYAFLKKHEFAIIPDELEVSVHLRPCREGEV